MMKTKILSATVLLGCALTANAQRITHTESLKDAFLIDYEVPLTKPASDYATIVTPLLCSPTDTLALEPVIVRGSRNVRKLHRDYVLNHKGEEPAYIAAADMPATVNGSASISLKDYPWVRHSQLTLCAKTEREGCCTVETLGLATGEWTNYVTPFTPEYNTVAINTGKAGQLEKDNPVLAHISSYKPYDRTRALRKEAGMLYVHFALDKWDIDRDIRDNASTLDRIIDVTRQVMNDTTSLIEKIQIIGLASVEGTVKHNEELAGNRAKALQQYVQQQLNLPDSLFDTVNGGEAWAELRDQITELDFEGRDEILRIIDTESNPDRREWLIRRHNGGQTYRYLRDNVLADQRNSGYLRIYYDYVPDKAAAIINEASQLLQQEKYSEALSKLQAVKTDSRAQNALGVALYMTGNEEEALQCFRRAAQSGNADALKNLEQLEP